MLISPKKLTIIIISSVVLSVSLGVIIGYFSAPGKSSNEKTRLEYYDNLIRDDDMSFLQEITKETNAVSISRYLE